MPAAGTTSSTTNGRSGRGAGSKSSPKGKLVVVLKMTPDSLRALVNPTKENNTPDIKGSSPASSSAADLPAARPSSADNGSDADAVSTPATGANAGGDTPRRKGVPGPKPGNKRTNGQTESSARSRGRPGPKKKPRLEEGGETSGRTGAPSRLGPKANTGAINAHLRSLDRTGAPCRRWERKPLQLRSFTGILWQLPSWRSYKSSKLSEDPEGTVAALESGDSDTKPSLAIPDQEMNGSSAVPSEKSHSGDVTPAPSNPVEASSPAIAMAA
ncbi:hypothetical protein N7474_010483 [Penicillium riverlandense]|uniref:uncharacterized protein n=1 Tax=Penicillium riverlandense TaxID=1903569 RepID=UPI002548B553|nr:uncharacterized protein N7474_010483 [Penicillium riverlandense]KAJ5806891.1 hypothetical protein N7474_010483 [Penicillium riverlandense]